MYEFLNKINFALHGRALTLNGSILNFDSIFENDQFLADKIFGWQ